MKSKFLLAAFTLLFSFNSFSQNNLAIDCDNNGDAATNSTIFTVAPTAFTVEWWMKPTYTDNYSPQVYGTSDWGSFVFHSDVDASVYVGIDGATRFTPTQLGPGTVTLNTWQHFAFTLGGGIGRFYKNGVLLASQAMNLPVAWNGIIVDGNCTFDELRIWNVERTQAQIAANMNTTISPQAGLVAYYPFTSGSAIAGGNNAGQTTATDYSGNGHTLMLNNLALNGASSNWVCGPSFLGSCSVNSIPTLSEWGLIIFALLLLCTGAVAVWNKRYAVAGVNA